MVNLRRAHSDNNTHARGDLSKLPMRQLPGKAKTKVSKKELARHQAKLASTNSTGALLVPIVVLLLFVGGVGLIIFRST